MDVLNLFYPINQARVYSAVSQLANPKDFAIESFSQQANLESFEHDESQLNSSYSQETQPRALSSLTSEPVFKKQRGKGTK